MGVKRRKARKHQLVQTPASQAKEHNQETIRRINSAVESRDITALRAVASSRGLVNAEIRSRLWPLLVDGDCSYVRDEEYEAWSLGEHRDLSVVRVDVERSLWSFTPGWQPAARAEARQQLSRLLNASVCCHPPGSVYYYQGLHDVGSALLLTMGERGAFGVLRALVVGHLRDATRASLDPVMEVLGLMGPIVQAADPELARLIQKMGLPPFYALSWFISWFSHDLPDLEEVARLFDLFMSSPPLMPLYLGAVAMRSQRALLLGAEDMPCLHSALVNLAVTKTLSADQLALQAKQLFSRAPPAQLISSKSLLLQQCITPRVTLVNGAWVYPEPRALGPGQWNAARLAALVEALLRLPRKDSAPRQRLALVSITGCVVSVSMLLLLITTNPHLARLA